MLSRFLSGIPALPLLACTGCAVYVPSTPSTPLVSRGQVEVRAGGRLLAQPALEAGVSWAPTAHLLLNADASLLDGVNNDATSGPDARNNTYHRQASVGLGYYRASPTPDGWYLAALGGVGYTAVLNHSYEAWLLFPYSTGTYFGTYWRGYAQGYAAKPLTRWLRGGFSLRGSVVSYRLTYEGQDVSARPQVFVEPSGFLRFGRKSVQGQLTVGLTQSVGSSVADPHRRYLAPSSMMLGGSLVLLPGMWWHRRN